jgi:hypothetical protein
MKELELARVLNHLLTTPNEIDSNGETPNIVDSLFAIAKALDRIADGIGRGSLSHEICFGVRKGLFGADCGDYVSILQLKED